MDRSLLIAEPIGGIAGNKITIATTHLESLNNAKIRKIQMEKSFEILNNSNS